MPKLKREDRYFVPDGRWFYDGLPGRPTIEPLLGHHQGMVTYRLGVCAVCSRPCFPEEASEWWGVQPVCNDCVTDFYWWCERRDRARGITLRVRRDARLDNLPRVPYRRSDVYRRDQGICHLCGKPVRGAWSLDHLVPVSLKTERLHPGDVIANAAVSHVGCNSKKGNRRADWGKYDALLASPEAPCPRDV
jgi:5-methylcytosine-specific restriction endonuclease McrA